MIVLKGPGKIPGEKMPTKVTKLPQPVSVKDCRTNDILFETVHYAAMAFVENEKYPMKSFTDFCFFEESAILKLLEHIEIHKIRR